jgi:CRP-like cAMP-binding protein
VRAIVPTAVEVLQEVSLFAGLSNDDRAGLATRLRRRQYPRGETLFLRGDPGSFLYVIDQGCVKIAMSSPEGREVTLALLGPGDFFGELSLLDGGERSADATVIQDASVFLLAREDFLRFLECRPRVAFHVMEVLSRRLRQTDLLVHDAAFFDVPGRLANVMLRLASTPTPTPGQTAEDGLTIGRHITQVDLAEMIGSTRESVNKWLSFYQRQGLIRIDRGQITILDPIALQRRAY